jgi:hypothetical protein
MTRLNKRAIAVGLAGAMALGAVSTGIAAPVMTSTVVLKAAQPSEVVDVRWRGRRGWAAAGIGFAAGALIGSTIARSRAYPDYYDDEPAFSGPPPAVYVEPAPVYAVPPIDPNGPGRRCWVSTDKDRGYGYWGPC